PGPGAAVVSAGAEAAYPTLIAGPILEKLGVRAGSSKGLVVHAVLPLKPDENKAESLVVTVELQAGKSRTGTVVGQDGKPLEGVVAAGLVPGEPQEPMKSPHFTAKGLV